MAIDDLYRDVILDHYRNPRRRGRLDGDAIHAEGSNPSCGDSFALDVLLGDGVIDDIATQGQGCSISQASGSMMADAVVGLSVDEARALATRFKAMMSIVRDEGVHDEGALDEGVPDEGVPGDGARVGHDAHDAGHRDHGLGDLEALRGVRKFPVRIRCADLAWATLEDALSRWETAAVG